jgi:hypothetical protein
MTDAEAGGSPRYPLAKLALAAALIGAGIAAAVTADPYANPDSHAFESLARSFLAGRGLVYREPMLGSLDLYAFRSPVYGVFLAIGLALGGVRGALAFQGAVAGATAALVGAIAARLGGRRTGYLALLLALAWPTSWRLAGQLMSETLYGGLAVAATWLALEAAARRSAGRAALAGIACALAVLTRPLGLGLVLVLPCWLAWKFPRGAAVCLAAAVLAWAPWPARNAQRLHAFVPILTSGGINAWSGNAGVRVSEGWEAMSARASLGEVGLDRYFWSLARDYAVSHPRAVAYRVARKSAAYAVPLERRPEFWLHRAAVLLALACLLFPAWRARLLLPGLVWLAHAVLSALTVVNDRYRWPTEWVVVLAAAFGTLAVLERVGRGLPPPGRCASASAPRSH